MESKQSIIWSAALSALVLGAGVAQGDTFGLTGIVRDFNYNGTTGGQIDFENAIGDDRGIVTSTLGTDGKPVYDTASHPSSTVTTHGPTAFNQWYRDTPGVNQSTQFGITLDNGQTAPGGVYTFASNSFFPIDNQLFGNQGAAHNYSFTYELHGTFQYGGGHQTLSFTGDDDVWIYINGQRVIDLGGVHPAESASYDLINSGLTSGGNYDIAIFFTERHTISSDFTLQTTFKVDSYLLPVPEAGTLAPVAGIAGLVGFSIWRRRAAKTRV